MIKGFLKSNFSQFLKSKLLELFLWIQGYVHLTKLAGKCLFLCFVTASVTEIFSSINWPFHLFLSLIKLIWDIGLFMYVNSWYWFFKLWFIFFYYIYFSNSVVFLCFICERKWECVFLISWIFKCVYFISSIHLYLVNSEVYQNASSLKEIISFYIPLSISQTAFKPE